MYAIIALLLIGVVSWLIVNMAGHDRYVQILGTESGALEMIMGIIGATVGCHLFLYTSSTRRLNSPPSRQRKLLRVRARIRTLRETCMWNKDEIKGKGKQISARSRTRPGN